MGKFELNENLFCTYRFSKGRISNILRTAYRMKLKLQGYDEGDI